MNEPSWMQIGIFVIQIIMLLAVIGNLIVYFYLLKETKKQVSIAEKSAKESAKAQNLFAITQYLQNEQIRNARRDLINRAKDKEFGKWDNEEDKKIASIVCASYDTLATLIKNDLIDKDLILSNWAASIINCYEITKEFIKKMQEENYPIPYWVNFPWLANEVKKKFEPSIKIYNSP
jgi:hypothetical protein